MTKNKSGIRLILLSVAIVVNSLITTVTWATDQLATIAVSAPLKSSSSLLGGKSIRTLQPGAAIKVLETKSTMSRVELVDEPSVKGWVLTASITRDKGVSTAIADAKMGSKNGKATQQMMKGSIGAVAKPFSGATAMAEAETSEAEAGALKNKAKGVVAGFTGKSTEALKKIESTKVTEEEIATFMKEGGLRSRLIR